MIEIISVRFKSGGKQYYFNPNGVQVTAGQGVIIETARGVERGECVMGNTMVDETEIIQPLRPMLRLETEEDKATLQANKEKEAKAFRICQEKIARHGLDMKLVEVEYSFDGSKILFFFTSEGRVDFRALVKDLASVFHTRIELRQIGVRDEAKMLGGLGICGRPFCCCGFLDEFQPVSIKMAKTQSLSLNPTKISGTCGRLMCCLKYEQDAYEDAASRMPKAESFVETPDGVGTVAQINLLKETVNVKLDESTEPPKCYQNCEIRVVRNGKGKRPEGYVPPSAEELAKLRADHTAAPSQTEEDRLSAALEGLSLSGPIGSRENSGEGEARTRRRSRSRCRAQKPKENGQPAAPAPQAQPAKPKGEPAPQKSERPPRPPKPKAEKPAPAKAQEGAQPAAAAAEGDKKPRRRRRYRPKGKSGETTGGEG